MKGVLERFADQDQAVILIEEVNQEIIVPIADLPQGSKVNTWFVLEKKHDEYIIVAIDPETTQEQAEKSSDLMAKLRAKKKQSKFRRK